MLIGKTSKNIYREIETGPRWLGRKMDIKGKRQELTGMWSLKLGGDTVLSRQSVDHPFQS